MSRIGKKPVELPSGVTATLSGQTIEVKGPKATHKFTATEVPFVSTDIHQSDRIIQHDIE